MDFFKLKVADYARYLLRGNLFTKRHSGQEVKRVTEAKYRFEFLTKKVKSVIGSIIAIGVFVKLHPIDSA